MFDGKHSRFRRVEKMKNRIVSITVFAFLSTCAAVLSTDESLAGDAAKGQQVYNTYCALCHGATGVGDGVGAAALEPKPRDLSSAEILQGYSDEYLTKVINEGGTAVGRSAAMPPWGGVISAQDTADVIAHIRQNLCKCEYKK